ncbi:DUF488 family protein [Clostridium tarantellae]|uniref:DUF488 family protein n=1 Tax=Clostridium tarantellae TaxID=39493 RepID=A0A6I1MRC4_9CLOT|nr:DUF488 domain-containing protein [Clostridium tarantellae]MPQ43431.1 DUF488 family protein [Clostridium tarantellae]
MEIFTIGTSNYDVERLMHMLRMHNINCVVDIRATPYSKYNKQFDKENIKYTLTKNKFIYIYMGKELAAKRETRESYNSKGYCDFEKVINEESFKSGIERLKIGCEKGYRIALLGAMQEPIRCQRGILVGRALRDLGFNMKHIVHDYSLKDQNFIEECLLEKYFNNRMQLTLDSLLGNEKSVEDLIKEGYRLANKEIGYRVENLK